MYMVYDDYTSIVMKTGESVVAILVCQVLCSNFSLAGL